MNVQHKLVRSTLRTVCITGSNNAVGETVIHVYNTTGNEIAVITGESSWLINFHNISSGITSLKCLKLVTVNTGKTLA